jgi:hypothetical protein
MTQRQHCASWDLIEMPNATRPRSLTVIVNTLKPNNMGGPTLYREEYADKAYNLCLLGATDKELAAVFGVGTVTINNWAKAHDDFGMAIALGGVHADAKVARSMYDRATGYTYTEIHPIKIKIGQYEERVEMIEVERHVPADPMAGKFWLTNRQKHLWVEASKIEHSGSIETGEKPVDEMSDDELFAWIEDARKAFTVNENVIDVLDVANVLNELGFD